MKQTNRTVLQAIVLFLLIPGILLGCLFSLFSLRKKETSPLIAEAPLQIDILIERESYSSFQYLHGILENAHAHTLSENISLNFIWFSDYQTEVLKRFASDNPPDLIFGDLSTVLLPLSENGFTFSDWSPYLKQLPLLYQAQSPQVLEQIITADSRIPYLVSPFLFSDSCFFIRKDWLDNLGLSLPDTPEGLLETARAFTYNDPDGNGTFDTYAFTSNGCGEALGLPVESLQAMWCPTGFFIDEDGSISHPMEHAYYKTYLDYIKTLTDQGLLDPDWYFQSNDQMLQHIFTDDNIGIAYLPQSFMLLPEYDANKWIPLPMPEGNGMGGRYLRTSPLSYLFTISREASETPEKMAAICRLLEFFTTMSPVNQEPAAQAQVVLYYHETSVLPYDIFGDEANLHELRLAFEVDYLQGVRTDYDAFIKEYYMKGFQDKLAAYRRK